MNLRAKAFRASGCRTSEDACFGICLLFNSQFISVRLGLALCTIKDMARFPQLYNPPITSDDRNLDSDGHSCSKLFSTKLGLACAHPYPLAFTVVDLRGKVCGRIYTSGV